MIGGDAYVRGTGLQQLQHRAQHPYHRTERRIPTLGKSSEAIEMAEQLVGAVD